MISLGIESSADKLGVGIIDDKGNVLSNIRRTYKPPYGSGIHPREASEFHSSTMPKAIEDAFHESGIKPKEIDLISFTKGPGLGPCLRIGAVTARTLSLSLGNALMAVNHPLAHV